MQKHTPTHQQNQTFPCLHKKKHLSLQIMYLPTLPKLTKMLLLLLFLHAFILSPITSSDLVSDRAALLALRAAVGGRTFFWNVTLSTPCNWQGVVCENTHNRVTALRLPASSLSGPIPPNTLSNLTLLRTLSLRLNHLSGPLPSDISRLTQLRNLYLQGNRFSGPLPDFLFSLHSLVRLNLAQNNFSGEIPSGFNNLTRLRKLYVENNGFTGVLPDIELSSLQQFNVSFNSLNGSVPKGLVDMPKNAFLGNSLCGKPLENACEANAETSPATAGSIGNINGVENLGKSKKKKLSGAAIAGIVIGSVVGFVILLFLLFIFCRKRSGNKTKSVDVTAIKNLQPGIGETPLGTSNEFSVAAAAAAALTAKGEIGGGANEETKKLAFFRNASQVFNLEELLRASAEVLGKGTFGTTYKAVLEVGTVVAVKRLKDVTISESQFREKIEGVGNLDHQNMVPLSAYYYSQEEKLLVYEYMPMGSLSALLHGNKGGGKTPLDWELRSRIALGAALGVEYLHSQGPNVTHGNIKSSNILLTKSYEPRVSDFGLNQLVGVPSSLARVAGYRAPEVTDPRQVSQKADVYSFGVLLLELLTGKAPSHALLNEEGVDLPRWVHSVVRDEWTSEVFDLQLLRCQNVEEEMVQLLQLAIDCTAQHPDSRPSIKEVAIRIEDLRRSSARGDHEQPDVVSELY